MSRTKGALGKKNNSLEIKFQGAIESKQVIEKVAINQEANDCSFKNLCITNLEKNNYNHICYNPLYNIENFDGECKLCVSKPKEAKIEVKKEESMKDILNEEKPVKRGRGRPRKGA